MSGCLTIFLIVFGVAVLGHMFSSKSPDGTASTSDSRVSAPAPPDPKQVALSEAKLDFSWSKGGFDTVMLADFVIHNNSEYTIKDIEIQCQHYAKSGTNIDSNTRTIFDIVKPHSKKGFPQFSMGFIHSQTASSSCKITDLKAF